MRRRKFLSLVGGAAVAWPLTARAQQGGQVRRIGVLTGLDEAEAIRRIGPFLQELQRLGWIDGRNIRIDKRVGAGRADAMRKYAGELATLAPDVILAVGSSSTEFSIQVTSTVPIVFTLVTDPLGAGFVDNLSRPGGNVTGFMLFEYSLSGKWLELVKQIAPDLKRAGVIRDPGIGAGTGQFAVIQAVAPSLGLEVSAINVRDPAAIERAVMARVREWRPHRDGGPVVRDSS
jgi:putative tryptophan/tyrosine transport system substrate-binding protein